MNSQSSDKYKTLTQPLFCLVKEFIFCLNSQINFKLIAILATAILILSLDELIVKAENTIQISGVFKGEGKVTGSGFKGNNKQKALAGLSFERNDLSLNIAAPDAGKQITYSCLIQQINTKSNDVTNWTIKCKIYDFTYADNYPGTIKTSGSYRIEIVKNKISLAQCDTPKKNTSANFIGS
jgi:hypothetical protein